MSETQQKTSPSEKPISFWKSKLEKIQNARKDAGKEFALVTNSGKMVSTFLTKEIGHVKPLRLEINITIDKSGTRALLDGLGHRIEARGTKETNALYEDFLQRIKKFDAERTIIDNSRKEVRKKIVRM